MSNGYLLFKVNPVNDKDQLLSVCYPTLLGIAKRVIEVTGYNWLETSYVRDSPSHKYGVSLDIAPDIAETSKTEYAAFNMSDPVLYKRAPLIRKLQRLARNFSSSSYNVGIFIESDHLHIQLFPYSDGRMRIYKWKERKPTYSDTDERLQLPMAGEDGYLC